MRDDPGLEAAMRPRIDEIIRAEGSSRVPLVQAALSPTSDPDSDARVRENFVDPDDRLVSIPAQRKKRMAILRWLAEDFQPGRRYPEAEVNRIISRRHPDFATLRRYLVDEELMQRQRGIYWRAGTVPNTGHDPSEFPGFDS
jgi:hypothetical protein